MRRTVRYADARPQSFTLREEARSCLAALSQLSRSTLLPVIVERHLDRFADHFRKLNDGPLPGSPVNAIPGYEYNDVTDDEISVEEVKSAINGLKKHKAPGIDTLDPPVYKSFTEPLINHLTMLYNQVLSSGEYPSTWSVGKIKPIFKNGSKSDPNNYRGISLLNVMAKLFSIIINRRLEWWVEINGVLNDSQYGFRKNRRTTDPSSS